MSHFALIALLALVPAAICGAEHSALTELVERASSDQKAAFSFDSHAWDNPDAVRQLPIGVFDSGIGGLTVLEAILTLDAFQNDTLQPGADGIADFANERFVYFGDVANMPYGNYSMAGRTDYLRELIVKDAIFLMGRRAWSVQSPEPHFKKPPVKAIVIACNTATAYGMEDIRAAVAAWKLPLIVVGVVDAGARGVVGTKGTGGVGILATAGTCASKVYPRTIEKALRQAGLDVPTIAQQGGTTLAGAIEGDTAFPEPVATYAMQEARALALAYRGLNPRKPMDTIVLGCTHYPLAEKEIDTAFAILRQEHEWHEVIAETRTFVNPAKWTALELFNKLAVSKLRLHSGESSLLANDAFFLSVARTECPQIKLAADGGLDHDYKYSRLPGQLDIEDTKNVPLIPSLLPAPSQRLLKEHLHAVWQRLGK